MQFGSLSKQIERAKLIVEWECDSITTNTSCVEHEQFLEMRKNGIYIKEPQGIDIKKKRLDYLREYSRLNPTKYGISVGYPSFFEYKDALYAFSYVAYMSIIKARLEKTIMFSLCKWDGSAWEILNSKIKQN